MSNKPSSNSLSLATKVINAGANKAAQGRAFRNGPQFASTFHLAGDVDSETYQYGRFGQPTWTELELGLSELEGAQTLVFPSGMSAAAAILTALIEPGDTIVLPSDGYAPVRFYVEKYLVKFGVKLLTVPTTSIDDFDFTGVSLALLETPSNPMLDTFDIERAAFKIHEQGGLLAIDNTTLTFMGQQPLKHGADLIMCADTKALNGHSDVLFGHVSSNNQVLMSKIVDWRKLSGNISGPMETWLVHRNLATLDVRLQRMCENALMVANLLQEHPKVINVRYPGLKTDPSHKLALQQQSLFGFIVTFELEAKDIADRFLAACSLVHTATSFGGVHSSAERRARWGTDNISEGVIRLSVGCERGEELINDIANALSRC